VFKITLHEPTATTTTRRHDEIRATTGAPGSLARASRGWKGTDPGSQAALFPIDSGL
jgi:hypothetical protein